MSKRNLATALWFLAGWMGGGLLAGLIGAPSLVAVVPGLLVAGLVRWDPTGLFWSKADRGRKVRPINEYAAELERRTNPGSATPTEQPTSR
jgi:hypothetical protein